MATGAIIRGALLGAGLAVAFAGGAMAMSAADVFAALTKPTGTAMGSVPSYSIDAIKGNEKIRAEMPAIDVAGIKFASGKTALGEADMAAVGDVAMALKEILSVRPFDVFLVEGHTDATGPAAANLRISRCARRGGCRGAHRTLRRSGSGDCRCRIRRGVSALQDEEIRCAESARHDPADYGPP
ncbi:MAG: hypothetical protein R3D02_09280 [Hyphomicrobiales bacterium]